MMANMAIDLCAERVIEELFEKFKVFKGYDKFLHLDLSNTRIGGECWEELLTQFNGFHSILLKNCKEFTDAA